MIVVTREAGQQRIFPRTACPRTGIFLEPRRVRLGITLFTRVTNVPVPIRSLGRLSAVGATAAVLTAAAPSFPGTFVHHSLVAADVAQRECLSLGDDMFDASAVAIGACRALGLHDGDRAGGLVWVYGNYQRRWLLAPSDTVVEGEVVLFTRPVSGDSSRLRSVWHYRYEAAMLRSVTPEVAPVPGGGVLLSIDECVSGTGGCSQSFAVLNRDSPKVVRLAFLDSLERRFPGAIRHGFHVDLRTLRGSLALYSGNDPNCCPSRIGQFSLRLRGTSLELVTLELRRPD